MKLIEFQTTRNQRIDTSKVERSTTYSRFTVQDDMFTVERLRFLCDEFWMTGQLSSFEGVEVAFRIEDRSRTQADLTVAREFARPAIKKG